MGKIIKLPDTVISKVAAGEVIENPASIIKELVENALDAGAQNIRIELKNNGIDYIKISDDGEGMDEADLRNSFLRHTTSKISDEADLYKVRSLGFRGEALYSITAVSKTTIRSAQKDAAYGNAALILYGDLEYVKPVGWPQGTSITVEELFQNVPARKKFLRNSNTEYKKILELITSFALTNPEIGFTLKNDGQNILSLPKKQSQLERITFLLKVRPKDHLLPIHVVAENVCLNGFISKPQFASKSPEQYLFVNNRVVNDTHLKKVIKKAYGTLIENKAYPHFVLNIELPHENVDVNVHPRKETVVIAENNHFYEQIFSRIAQTLENSNITYKTDLLGEPLNRANVPLTKYLKENADTWNIKTDSKNDPQEIIQIKKLYLLTEVSEGLLLIDQHAAHERILYEEFLEHLDKNKKQKTVQVNNVFELPLKYSAQFDDILEIFEKLSVSIEPFGAGSFRVTHAPETLKNENLGELIKEWLQDDTSQIYKSVDDKTLQTISYLACRTAIKAGDYLTMEERKNLLQKLETTKTAYTCPHGRPVSVCIKTSEIARIFKRA